MRLRSTYCHIGGVEDFWGLFLSSPPACVSFREFTVLLFYVFGNSSQLATATRSARQRRRRQRHALRCLATSRAPTSPSSASAHHLYGTPSRELRLVQLGSRRGCLGHWGGARGWTHAGGDTITAGTFQGEMPALCVGGIPSQNACMHLMTLTPQHTTSAVSRRGGDTTVFCVNRGGCV